MANADQCVGDLTRLVQHVALNESGWWEQAVQRLVLACAYTLGSSSREDVIALVVESCGVQSNSEHVESTIQRLIEAGSLIEHDGSLRVSQEMHEALEQQETLTLESEEVVRIRFEGMAQDRGLYDQVDELWQVMETEVVLPVVRNMGARMYGLLIDRPSDGNGDLEAQMRDFLSRRGNQVRAFLADFLDPSDQDVRRFVLRRLNAQYALDAAALPHDALEQLSHLHRRARRVDVFLDTNFLFSVLGLHENPGDGVANDLMQLVRDLEGWVELRMYVLPETIKETRGVLQDVIVNLGDFRGQRNLAEAARRTTSLGLASRYLNAISEASNTLTAEEFFGPYESDLVSILRSKGVELFNADLSHLHVDQEVVDDLHDQAEVQERFRSRGVKPYEANLHDMVLWHFTRSRRDSALESPLEVTAWVVTLDYGLINFDRHKRRGTSGPPVCLEPSSLIQLFQFWVPSSTELDEALVGSVRQPLLFLTFDQQSEQVTLRILNQLSRFEGAGDLDPEVVSEILTNSALRNRLEGTTRDRIADEEIVKEEMVNVLRQLGDQLADLRSKRAEERDTIARLEERVSAAETSTEADEERAARLKAEQSLSREIESRRLSEDENRKFAGQIAKLESRLSHVESENKELAQDLHSRDQERVARRESWRLGSLTTATVVLTVAILIVAGAVLNRWLEPLLAWVVGVATGLLALLVGLEFAASGTHYTKSWPIRQVSRLRRFWWTFLLAVIASVVADLFL